MSNVAPDDVDPMVEDPQNATESTPKPTYKSYKKKYNKLRHVFNDKMKTSNTLFEDEQRAFRVARRLQEQNDQLLDLLLEVNESNRVPIHLRYDLRSPTPSESALPGLEPDVPSHKRYDTSSARAALEEAKVELATGQISPRSYNQLEAAITETLQNPLSLADLDRTPHSRMNLIKPGEVPVDLVDPVLSAYLTLDHEEEYLSALDAALGIPTPNTQSLPDSHPIRSNEREKDSALRNPVSVYNWLRKNHPGIFLQDGDPAPDKPPSKPAGTSRSARKAGGAARAEAEIIDEDGNVVGGIPVEAPSRSKRKREDEPYRPKGGSSRSSKRKKTSGGQGERQHIGEDEGF